MSESWTNDLFNRQAKEESRELELINNFQYYVESEPFFEEFYLWLGDDLELFSRDDVEEWEAKIDHRDDNFCLKCLLLVEEKIGKQKFAELLEEFKAKCFETYDGD